MVVCSECFPSDSVKIPPHTEFKKLVEYSSEKKLKVLVGSNVNAHHTEKGSSDVNPNGESLCEYLIAQGPLVQNKEKEQTYITRG